MRISIYSLNDKATGLRFYIGKTECSLPKRKAEHKSLAAKRPTTPVYAYIVINNVDFEITEIDSIQAVSSYSVPAINLEQQWISFLRGEGYMLFNIN